MKIETGFEQPLEAYPVGWHREEGKRLALGLVEAFRGGAERLGGSRERKPNKTNGA